MARIAANDIGAITTTTRPIAATRATATATIRAADAAVAAADTWRIYGGPGGFEGYSRNSVGGRINDGLPAARDNIVSESERIVGPNSNASAQPHRAVQTVTTCRSVAKIDKRSFKPARHSRAFFCACSSWGGLIYRCKWLSLNEVSSLLGGNRSAYVSSIIQEIPSMGPSFDPYHKWLGIPPEEQPPSHYRLLGIREFETDPDVIEAAADQRMGHLRRYQTSQHAELSQRLLNEVAAARICLLNPSKRAAYDEQLKLARPAATALTGPSPRSVAFPVVEEEEWSPRIVREGDAFGSP